MEVELCGHATLAAAHALYETGRVPLFQRIHFETLHSGVLTAQGNRDGNIELNFPATLVTPLLPDLVESRRAALRTALSVTEAELLFVGSSVYDLVVEVTREAFARLAVTSIDFGLLAEQGGRGVLVTARGAARAAAGDEVVDVSGMVAPASSAARQPRADIVNDERFDFVSRCFFPR